MNAQTLALAIAFCMGSPAAAQAIDDTLARAFRELRAATTAARLAGGGALPRLDLVVTEHGPEAARDAS